MIRDAGRRQGSAGSRRILSARRRQSATMTGPYDPDWLAEMEADAVVTAKHSHQVR